MGKSSSGLRFKNRPAVRAKVVRERAKKDFKATSDFEGKRRFIQNQPPPAQFQPGSEPVSHKPVIPGKSTKARLEE